MRTVFANESIDAVVHFAANSLVGESMEKPLEYFDNNVYGTQVLLQVMTEYDVNKIVFSSTAATYGEPESVPNYRRDANESHKCLRRNKTDDGKNDEMV